MSRTPDRAIRFASRLATLGAVALVGLSLLALCGGCDQLDGRNRNRKGNKLFRETQFVDAAAEYERALTEVDDPVIHYNLGLAYSKVFHPGSDKPVLLGVQGEFVCTAIPNVKTVAARVCVKPGDRHFNECDDKNVCPSSFTCTQASLCAVDSPTLADMAATHLAKWIDSQPPDDVLDKKIDELKAELEQAQKHEEAEANSEKQHIESLEKRIDELMTKAQTRELMSQFWIDTDNHKKAIAYWEKQLADKPGDLRIMGILAGINLKAGDWRKSIEWYTKVGESAKDPTTKVAGYQSIGNVAWSKLNSKSLPLGDSVELADRGIGALQKAAEMSPKNPSILRLTASIFTFRGLVHGASFAGALDRATGQDLLARARVLAEEAKKAQGVVTPPAAPTPPPPPTPPTPMSGGSAQKAGG